MDRGIYRRICGSVFFFFSLLLLAAFPARAGQFLLVEDGAAKAPIVVFENAPPLTRAIADELAGYIEKISGARPEVLEGRPEPLPESAVWVGYQPVLEELFPGFDFDFEHPEEILISTDGSHLVIAGRDRWDPDTIVTASHWRGMNPTVGWQAEHGTINAVYTFLRDWLEVRWLWPGETGLDIIPMERIAFAPFEYRYHPQIRMRSGLLSLSSAFDRRGLAGGDWARFQRIYFDSGVFPGSHNFTDWWERFHESNPEYLALQPDGTRSGYPGPGREKICQSNPAVWEQWLADVEARLETNPNLRFFGAAFNDNHTGGHCICENCRAWDEPDAPRRNLIWEGLSQRYVSLSDRDVRFGNELARLLRERYPERDDYRVCILAYGINRPAPVRAVPDDNVVVIYVGNIGAVDHTSPEGEESAKQFADWAATGAKMIYRPNVGGVANPLVHRAMPDMIFDLMTDTFRYIADHNCIGLYFDTMNEAWPTQGPLYYLMAHLAWDPYADSRAILDDYYRRGFGPAHEQLAAYWDFMQETRWRWADAGLPWTSYYEVYDQDFFRHASGLLDEAGALLADGPEIYLRRLEHVRAGLEFTRLLVDTENQWARYRESGERDEEAADRVRDNWVEMMRIGRQRMIYMHGLQRLRNQRHPDSGGWSWTDLKEPGDRRVLEIEQIP